jgi:hypothetical protein
MSPARATLTRLTALVALGAVAVVGCGDDDEDAATTTSSALQIDTPASVTPTSALGTAVTIAPVTVETSDIPYTVPGTGDIPTLPPNSVDMPLVIDVVVGEETGPDRIETVPLGSTVTITIVNEDEDDEYHLHGYDLGDGEEFEAGETAAFTFTADMPGDFELESHESEDVLLILRVQ